MASTSKSSSRCYSLISELNSKRSDWKIKVRVSRLWDVVSTKNKNHNICTDMVLIDEEGEYLHATLPSPNTSHLRKKITEGKVYMIKNFEVVDNKKQYRVVSDSKIMINLQFDTFIKAIQEENTILKHRFDFVEFHDLDHRRDNFYVLTDIYGVVVNEFGDSNDLKIEIEDQCGKRVRVKLWGQCITDYIEQKKQIGHEHKVVIAAITSLLVKDYKGNLSLSTSPSSKVYLNLDIHEVNELKEILSGKYDNATGSIVDCQNHVSHKTDIQAILSHCQKKYEKDSTVCCLATVTGINSKSPWYYSSCIDCNCKPHERATDFWCFKCNKVVENQTLRYRIELCVQDDHASTIFTVLDSQAKKMIGQDATSLYDAHTNEVDENDENYSPIPELIRTTFVGKEFLFTLNINAYNHDPNKRQTFSLTKIQGKPTIEIDETPTSNEDSNTQRKRTLHNDEDRNSDQYDTNCSTTAKKVKSSKVRSRKSSESRS